MSRTIGLVWAQAANGVIGREGKLPWHLPEDLAHFKRLTADATVIMGRKTWESLPAAFRPLPGRQNVVVSRTPNAVFPGATAADSLAGALRDSASEKIWVIGGASIYAAALAHADQVVITELEESFPGDTYAPALGPGWRPVEDASSTDWCTAKSGLRYRVRSYVAAGSGRP
jgi:dihydrofolate reductase